jgi:hypothetical protein
MPEFEQQTPRGAPHSPFPVLATGTVDWHADVLKVTKDGRMCA